MKSMSEKNGIPLGVKIIAIFFGIVFLTMVCITWRFLITPERFRVSDSRPIWLQVTHIIFVDILLGCIAIGLWRLNNWTRRVVIGFCSIACINIINGLIRYHLLSYSKEQWGAYIFPIILIYLLIPSVRNKFVRKKQKIEELDLKTPK